MDTQMDILAALLGWGITGYLSLRLFVVKRTPESKPHIPILADNWKLAFSLTLYFTLSVEPIARQIDSYFPWYQSAQLLAYISVAWAAWWISQIAIQISGGPPNFGVTSLPIAMTVFCLAIFPFTLARVPASTEGMALALPEILFRNLLYFYVLALLLLSVAACRRLLQADATPLVHLRLYLSLFSLLAASALAIVKIGTTVVHLRMPDAPWLVHISWTANLLQLMIILPWFLLYPPARLYLPALQLWHALYTFWLLLDVRQVELEVSRFYPPFFRQTPSLWQRLTQPDYYANRSLIHILDARRQMGREKNPEALTLYQRLEGVHAQMETRELLLFYAGLGRQLRTERRNTTAPGQEVGT